MADKTADKNVDKEALKAAKEAEKAAKKAKQERIRQSKPKKEGNVFSRAGASIKKFWKDFIGTVKKVVWPDGKQVLKSSLVVLATIIVIGLVIFGIDRGLKALYDVSRSAMNELGENRKASISQSVDEADADAEADAEANAEADAEANADANAEADANDEAEANAEAEAEANAEADANAEAAN